jgi:hypothetical protein
MMGAFEVSRHETLWQSSSNEKDEKKRFSYSGL